MHDNLFWINIDYAKISQDFMLHKKKIYAHFLTHISEKNPL